MRRLRTAIVAGALAVSLAGCAPAADDHTDLTYSDGACLDGMNGEASDRTALVDCDEPHLFEITAISVWTGMPEWTDADDLRAIWDALHLEGASPEAVAYAKWASRACTEAAQHTIGIADVEVQGHTAANLWLRMGGTYDIDTSLPTREEMTRDESTACALAWYDAEGAPRMLSGPTFSQLRQPDFGLDRRECRDVDHTLIPCEQPHAAQVMLEFDGLEAFGPGFITRAASATEADEAISDAFCHELLQQTMPSNVDLGELSLIADISPRPAWDRFDGTVDPDGGYFFACLAVGPQAGDLFTGDVFDGTTLLARSGDTA